MAYISFKPTDYFNTNLYTGNAATNAITGVGFQPAMTWVKSRSNVSSANVFDALRTTYSIAPSDGAAQYNSGGDGFTSLDSDGFTLNGSGGGRSLNVSGSTYASWNWKMGTTTGKPTVGETITPSSYSIDTTAKQGVYAYTGTGSTGSIAHGLGVTPKLIIVKQLNTTRNWTVSNIDNPDGIDGMLYLNDNSAVNADASGFDLSSSTTITFNDHTLVNESGGTYVCYVFSPVDGYSSYGAYKGNADVDGSFIYTGFRPNMILIKNTSGQNWNQLDAVRNPSNVANKTFTPDTTAAEATNGTGAGDKKIDILSNGFKIRTNSNELNQSGVNHIYMAWAQEPLVSSNSKAGTAR